MSGYMVISGNSLEELNRTLAEKSDEGYKPSGGVQVAPGPLGGSLFIVLNIRR